MSRKIASNIEPQSKQEQWLHLQQETVLSMESQPQP